MTDLLNQLPTYFPANALTAPMPRYVVCVRKLEQRKPGMETRQHKPKPVGAYWKLGRAQLQASLQCVMFRRRGFTITEIQCEGPVKWEACKLSPTGAWMMFEITIDTIQ